MQNVYYFSLSLRYPGKAVRTVRGNDAYPPHNTTQCHYTWILVGVLCVLLITTVILGITLPRNIVHFTKYSECKHLMPLKLYNYSIIRPGPSFCCDNGNDNESPGAIPLHDI